jgi:hypothetical protein
MKETVPMYLWIQEQGKPKLVLKLGVDLHPKTDSKKQKLTYNTEKDSFWTAGGGITPRNSEIHTLITSV